MQELINEIRSLDENEEILALNHPKMVYVTSYDVYEKLPSYLKTKVDHITELCEQYLATNGRTNLHGWAEVRRAGYKVEQGDEDLAVLTTMITKIAFDCY